MHPDEDLTVHRVTARNWVQPFSALTLAWRIPHSNRVTEGWRRLAYLERESRT